MENRSPENMNRSTLSLLEFLYHWRKHLAIITGAAIVFSALATFLIPNQYKAVSTLFAVKSFSASRYLTEEPPGVAEDYMDIGDEDDIEKLLTVLSSTELQDLVVKKFDLYNHWKISSDDSHKETWMNLKFQEMISFKRTDILSVKIEVYDYSPDTAAQIANAIAAFADTVKNRYTKRIALEALNIVQNEYDKTLIYMKVLEDSMQVIRGKGVLEYNLQVEALTRSLGKAMAGGNSAGVSKIEERLKTFEKFGGPFFNLTNEVMLQKERQVFLKSKLDAAYLNATRNLPGNLQVQKAKISDRKSKPVRWLIILISALSVFAGAIMVIIISDKYKAFKKKMTAIS
jgi:capsular polysaccharide biosynthesis protein